MRPLVLAPQTKKLAKSGQKPSDLDAVPKTLKAIVIGLAPFAGGAMLSTVAP
jgi:hypothetical protein